VCERCTEVWAKICDDPVIAAERPFLEKFAPFFEKLDPYTKRRFYDAQHVVVRVAKAKFGIENNEHDLSPLCDRSKLKLVDLVADHYARPNHEGMWSYPHQAGHTEDPETRLLHCLLEMHESLGRYYNALLDPIAARKQHDELYEWASREIHEEANRNPGYGIDYQRMIAAVATEDDEEIARERERFRAEWWSRAEVLKRIVAGLEHMSQRAAWALEDAKELQTQDLINSVPPAKAAA
jgi:hypothetical protein